MQELLWATPPKNVIASMITKLYKIIILLIHEFTLSVAKAVQI